MMTIVSNLLVLIFVAIVSGNQRMINVGPFVVIGNGDDVSSSNTATDHDGFVVDESPPTPAPAPKCEVSLISETPVRDYRGCYLARFDHLIACQTIKYHRIVEQCCRVATNEFLIYRQRLMQHTSSSYSPRIDVCHRLQAVYHDYCIRIPSYLLEEGCHSHRDCDDKYDTDSGDSTNHIENVDLSLDKSSFFNATTDDDCLSLRIDRYDGEFLAGCHKQFTSRKVERRCIFVKRTMPHRKCCDAKGNVDFENRDNNGSVDSLTQCVQYREIESQYCFDVPAERIIACDTQVDGYSQQQCTETM